MNTYLDTSQGDGHYDQRYYVTTATQEAANPSDPTYVTTVANGNGTFKNYINDSSANADEFTWAADTTIEDAQYHDRLFFYGMPLVGGTNDGGMTVSTLGGLAGPLIAGAIAGAQEALNHGNRINETFFDNFFPMISYRFSYDTQTGGYDLIIGDNLTARYNLVLAFIGGQPVTPAHPGEQTIKNFISAKAVKDNAVPIVYRGSDLQSLSQNGLTGKLGMVFKANNPIYAILAHLPETLITFAASGGGPLADAALTDAYYVQQHAAALKWSNGTDPLVLDLTGNGLETTSLDNSIVHFDLNNDYFSERTGWLGPDSGFLVLDSVRARASGGRARAVAGNGKASAWRKAPFHFGGTRNKRCPTYIHLGYKKRYDKTTQHKSVRSRHAHTALWPMHHSARCRRRARMDQRRSRQDENLARLYAGGARTNDIMRSLECSGF